MKKSEVQINVEMTGLEKATTKVSNFGRTLKGATRPDPVADMATYFDKLTKNCDKASGAIGSIGSMAASFGGPWGVAIAGVATGIVAAANKFDLFGEKAAEAREKTLDELAKMKASALEMELEDLVYGTNKQQIEELKKTLEERNKVIQDYQRKVEAKVAEKSELYNDNGKAIRKLTDRVVSQVNGVVQYAVETQEEADARAASAVKSINTEIAAYEQMIEAYRQGSLEMIRDRKRLEDAGKSVTDTPTKAALPKSKSAYDFTGLTDSLMDAMNSMTSDKLKNIKDTLISVINNEDIDRASKQTAETMLSNIQSAIDDLDFNNSLVKSLSDAGDEFSAMQEDMRYNLELLKKMDEAAEEYAETLKKQQWKEQQKAIEATSGVIGSAGDAMSAFADKSEEAATATKALAIAEKVASLAAAIHAAAEGDPYTVAPRIAAAVAAVVAGFAAFADGGVVGGSQRVGDMQLVRVNSGEMILNGSQQAKIFSAIQNGNFGGGGQTVIYMKTEGKELQAATSNYNTSMRRLR